MPDWGLTHHWQGRCLEVSCWTSLMRTWPMLTHDLTWRPLLAHWTSVRLLERITGNSSPVAQSRPREFCCLLHYSLYIEFGDISLLSPQSWWSNNTVSISNQHHITTPTLASTSDLRWWSPLSWESLVPPLSCAVSSAVGCEPPILERLTVAPG